MTDIAIQDTYPEDLSQCYGCGRLNELGLQLKTYWRDGETLSHFTPEARHTAIPGYVYGGLIASLFDCHGTATAAAAARHAEGGAPGDAPPRFVTASLQVDFDKPTPLGGPLEIHGRVDELKERRVIVEMTLSAEGVVRARGRVVAARMPASMTPQAAALAGA
ncbi:PaaI family thioesterase [Roseospirillum parvum]|uniref:Acyl-coenzyme A thioesterase PaaI, contains HGG motif n=1 Tax=Roseospirillum parvum TaxID=83401 RepID=A0A1G7WW37_9PROT|nr:PaaI family thioesterase [Roseospirillum parvum]SDG76124.1 Acyl-coenzyme A thioesterase PaaI, contains HGG motif [Roseospirillum parvum]